MHLRFEAGLADAEDDFVLAVGSAEHRLHIHPVRSPIPQVHWADIVSSSHLQVDRAAGAEARSSGAYCRVTEKADTVGAGADDRTVATEAFVDEAKETGILLGLEERQLEDERGSHTEDIGDSEK